MLIILKMSTVATLSSQNVVSGNTKKPRVCSSKCWCFTYNNYNEDTLARLKTSFEADCEKWVMGKEIGSEGTPHIQGYIKAWKKIRPIEHFDTKDIHWEKAKGSIEENWIYCTKDGSYESNFFLPLKIRATRIPKFSLKKEIFFPWQQRALDRLLAQNARQLLWVFSKKGNLGKSSFAEWIVLNYEGANFLENGSKKDLMYILKLKNEMDFVIFDFSRTVEDYVSYDNLESIKNGRIVSTKYEGSVMILDYHPRVAIFANFEPEYSKLSSDRWDIMCIDENSDAGGPDTAGREISLI